MPMPPCPHKFVLTTLDITAKHRHKLKHNHERRRTLMPLLMRRTSSLVEPASLHKLVYARVASDNRAEKIDTRERVRGNNFNFVISLAFIRKTEKVFRVCD